MLCWLNWRQIWLKFANKNLIHLPCKKLPMDYQPRLNLVMSQHSIIFFRRVNFIKRFTISPHKYSTGLEPQLSPKIQIQHIWIREGNLNQSITPGDWLILLYRRKFTSKVKPIFKFSSISFPILHIIILIIATQKEITKFSVNRSNFDK